MYEPKFQHRHSRGFTSRRPPNNSLRGSIAVLLILWCSAIAVAAEPIPLRAGAMSMVFEPDNALLRYLKVGSDEVLRGISAPVRNQYWGTTDVGLIEQKITDQNDSSSRPLVLFQPFLSSPARPTSHYSTVCRVQPTVEVVQALR